MHCQLSLFIVVVVVTTVVAANAHAPNLPNLNQNNPFFSALEEKEHPNPNDDDSTLRFIPKFLKNVQSKSSRQFKRNILPESPEDFEPKSPGKMKPKSSQSFKPKFSQMLKVTSSENFKHKSLKKVSRNERIKNFRRTPSRSDSDEPRLGNVITCGICKFIVGTLKVWISAQRSKADIIKLAIQVCKTFKIESDRVCDLVISQYADMVIGVVKGTILNPDEVCGLVLGKTCAKPFNPFGMWNISISKKPKPPVKPHVLPKPGSPTLRFLQLTDIHLDIAYEPGADAECGEPLCCRAYDTYPAPTTNRRAGQWGDYRNCDTPLDTLEQLFVHLRDIKDQFDYVLFTGDIAAHDVWNQTRTQQLDKLSRLVKLFRTYLPDKPVYPCPGNHEGVPCNSFPPDTVEGQSLDWLYSAYLEAWGYWLPPSVSQTIMRGGFYTFSPFPGYRIISLNSNYGHIDNWWLLINSTDPQGQLQWLADTLQTAEDKGEKVHILSHHPPNTLMKGYAFNYYRLVNRYESTIIAQFHGHTHKDQYEVFYDLHNISRPVAISYVGGSVTTYSYSNPGYRIYTMDGHYNQSSWQVLDYTHYYVDLPNANKEKTSPIWEEEYTPKKMYQMPSLFPENWSDLVYRMKANDTLFQEFYRNYHKSAPSKRCGKICKHKILCNLKSAGSGNKALCNDV